MWGGRFKSELAEEAKAFSYSLATDFELFEADIQLNEAWVKVLAQAKILKSAEKTKLLKGLASVKKRFMKYYEIDKTPKEFLDLCYEHEDVHSLIQVELEKSAGAVAKKLRTGRSRNDQVTTALRLYLKKVIPELIKSVTHFQKVLVQFAQKNQKVTIPGYTHLQRAQVVSMSHAILAYVEMLERDKERFQDALKRIDVLPLGSGALGGATYSLSRDNLKKLLGFSKVSDNSIDATADRDYVIEVLSGVSQMYIHLSRLSEDMILWNSTEFDFITLDDAYATGSSLMPQKKNPDLFELTRGRSGKAVGHLVSALMNQKGLPLCYNRDLQEDKEDLFPALHLAFATLEVLQGAIKTTQVNHLNCQICSEDSFLYATDLLDYLVGKGLSFSDAHRISGEIVQYAISEGFELDQLSLDVYQKLCSKVDKSVYKIYNPTVSITKKKTHGSTSPSSVKKQLVKWKNKLK